MLQNEVGADVARLVLRRYDRETGTFSGHRAHDFWDAVRRARALGRTGAGRRVAIVDGGFDTTYPAIARQRLVGGPGPEGARAHGTAVALLVLEVAPDAELDLHTVDGDVRSGFDDAATASAIRAATASGVDVLNLSLGERHPIGAVLDIRGFADASPWPEMTTEDVPFWAAEVFAARRGWRDWLRPVRTGPVEEAVTEAIAAGVTVVAACGNEKDHLYSPALLPGVFSVAFLRERRATAADGGSVATAANPSGYSQSQLADYALVQSSQTVGSSFATPLVSGFVATMPDRTILPAYRDAMRLAAEAGALLPNLKSDPDAPARRIDVVDSLYTAAVEAAPHPHFRSAPGDTGPCPECAVFALNAYSDGGLFWLDRNAVKADAVLRAAVRFAPDNAHAAANHGFLFAVRAWNARGTDPAATRDLLRHAARSMSFAADELPDDPAVRARADEFLAALDDPASWEWNVPPRTPEESKGPRTWPM